MFGKKNRKLSHKASSSFPPKDSYSIIEKKSDALDSFFFSSSRIFSPLRFSFVWEKKKTQWSRSTADEASCRKRVRSENLHMYTFYTSGSQVLIHLDAFSLSLAKKFRSLYTALKVFVKIHRSPFLHLERLLAEGQLRAALVAEKKKLTLSIKNSR